MSRAVRLSRTRVMRALPLVLAVVMAMAPILNGTRASSRNRSSNTNASNTYSSNTYSSNASNKSERTTVTLAPGSRSSGSRANQNSSSSGSSQSQASNQSSNRVDPRLRRIGFASRRGLESHWQKHGSEFGNPTLEQYLAMAQDLRDAPLSSRVIEATQSNGSIARFDRKTGAFLAFNNDLTIRTFFRPDDGEAYFRRAVNRR